VIVVSNTSPIINLAAVGQLQLLWQLYGRIIIPQAVYREIVIVGAGQPGAVQVKSSDWIEMRPVSDQALVASLQLKVDEGEAEAIALAAALNADLVLLDERRGRVAASHLGLRYVGLLGILIEAKHNGLVSNIKPILDDLLERAGFWVAQELYDRVLQAAGESNP
jgi:predicted nucleic acid-binding protein